MRLFQTLVRRGEIFLEESWIVTVSERADESML
jgi:hypothetical protein